MNFINENENKAIKLFEKQGVAAFRYNNVIKEIVNFIKKNNFQKLNLLIL